MPVSLCNSCYLSNVVKDLFLDHQCQLLEIECSVIVKILLTINFPIALLERFLSILNIRIKFKFQKTSKYGILKSENYSRIRTLI